MLLRPSTEFVWDETHTAAINNGKAALTLPTVLAFYEPGLETRLKTDASRTKGLRNTLWQHDNGTWKLVQCSSWFINGTESRHTMIKLELLAAAWAIKKFHVYLASQPFTVIVDHQPLVLILNTWS